LREREREKKTHDTQYQNSTHFFHSRYKYCCRLLKILLKKFFFVKVFNNWKKRFSILKTLFLAGKNFFKNEKRFSKIKKLFLAGKKFI